MSKPKIASSSEKISAFDQVKSNSGHDWMKGHESSADYFARAREEAVRSQQRTTGRVATSRPSARGRLRRALSALAGRLKGAR